jgi:deferrochelatase/peroxidase EfeB/plastocyanin
MASSMQTVIRRVSAVAALLFGALAFSVLSIGAAPASAHTVGGSGATNFRTTLDSLSPAVPGLSLEVVENGTKLEIDNRSGADVVVDGYVGDQYLKVGPGGTFVNTQSPATYLNNDRWGKTAVPAGVDPSSPPVWKKVSSEPVYRWHDHRIHWMSTALPPAVQAKPGDPHAISGWTVTLHRDGQVLTAAGRLEWVPGPSKALWLGGVFLAFVLAVLACRHQRLRKAQFGTGFVAVALVAADLAHSIGVAADASGGIGTRIGTFFSGNVLQLLAWAVALSAAFRLLRPGPGPVQARTGAVWLAGGAGLLIAAASGVPDLSVLWSSTAPFAGDVATARFLITCVTGLGFGLAVSLPFYLRRTRDLPAAAASEPELASEPEPEPGHEHELEPEFAAAGDEDADGEGPTRRLFLTTGVTGVGGVAAGAATAALLLDERHTSQPAVPAGFLVSGLGTATVSAPGPYQAGIAVPSRQQAHGTVAAFDLVDGATKDQLKALLQGWTRAIADLTAGRPTPSLPDDAIATGSGPSSLTVTVGVGPSLFGKAGLDAAARPPQLTPLPAFGDEHLDPARSDGDLGVVLAADDALVVFHVQRTLTRLAAGVATPRWSMSGFTRSPGSAPDDASTGRNLMGQLDGTDNPRPDQPDFAAKVFVRSDADPGWMRGGSYLVLRRIRMLLDSWDQLPQAGQEQVIGRRKSDGAPLSGGGEHTPVNLTAQNKDGSFAVAPDAHIRLAAAASNQGSAMLRRGLSYHDGLAADGKPDAGLLFLAWQADPAHGFIPVQQRLTHGMDALNRFIRHETSALFAMVPAAGSGSYLGQELLEPGSAASSSSSPSSSSSAAVPPVALPSTIADGGTGQAVLGPDGVQRITVAADDALRYHPSVIQMVPGTIEITFQNKGDLPHTLSESGPPQPGEPSAGVPQLAGGHQTRMSLKLTRPGDYPFQCGYHSAEGMYAVIRVRG